MIYPEFIQKRKDSDCLQAEVIGQKNSISSNSSLISVKDLVAKLVAKGQARQVPLQMSQAIVRQYSLDRM